MQNRLTDPQEWNKESLNFKLRCLWGRGYPPALPGDNLGELVLSVVERNPLGDAKFFKDWNGVMEYWSRGVLYS